MQPSERSRNFALKADVDDFKAKLQHNLEKLMSVPWHDPAKVPLLALESSVQVQHTPLASPFMRRMSGTFVLARVRIVLNMNLIDSIRARYASAALTKYAAT